MQRAKQLPCTLRIVGGKPLNDSSGRAIVVCDDSAKWDMRGLFRQKTASCGKLKVAAVLCNDSFLKAVFMWRRPASEQEDNDSTGRNLDLQMVLSVLEGPTKMCLKLLVPKPYLQWVIGPSSSTYSLPTAILL